LLLGAWDDWLQAEVWYASVDDDLVKRFDDALNVAVAEIRERPTSWPRTKGNCRYRLVKGFPFRVLYYLDEEVIVVVAIAHLRRKPGYWLRRLRNR